ncbi:MAG: preprotein translocase subunit SecD, partial [Nocardioidaceae bacterium]|nr:preprotein translocase subunit SecD [Nocardioidaceae bacterium]
MAKKTPKPGRTLLIFVVVVAALYAIVAFSAPGTAGESRWKPALGLDLEGGTRITLTASGKQPSATQLKLAASIIDQRANGTGVAEASTKTQGGRNIVVEIPGKNRRDLVDSVKRTAQLRFRLVAAAAAGTPAPATPSASPSGTVSPSAGATG